MCILSRYRAHDSAWHCAILRHSFRGDRDDQVWHCNARAVPRQAGDQGKQKRRQLVLSEPVALSLCTARLMIAALTKLWRHNARVPPQATAHNLHLNLAIGEGLCNPLLVYPFLQATVPPMKARLSPLVAAQMCSYSFSKMLSCILASCWVGPRKEHNVITHRSKASQSKGRTGFGTATFILILASA